VHDRHLVVVFENAVPRIPNSCSSAARSAPMLAAPKTGTPSDIAQRISLCQTAGAPEKKPSMIPIARGRLSAAR